jgi:hypothetical protein
VYAFPKTSHLMTRAPSSGPKLNPTFKEAHDNA